MFLYDSAFILWRGNVHNDNGNESNNNMLLYSLIWKMITWIVLYTECSNTHQQKSTSSLFLNGLIILYIFKSFLRQACILPTLQITMEIIPFGVFPLCKRGRGKTERERGKGENFKKTWRGLWARVGKRVRKNGKRRNIFEHQFSLQNNMKIVLALAQPRPYETNGWARRLLLVHVNKRLLCLWFSVAAREGRAFLQT